MSKQENDVMNDIIAAEQRNAILKARALALAEEPAPERDIADLEVLEFRLDQEIYGIESSFVAEVYPLKEFTPLPGTPAFVLGIMSMRGQIFSIVDLRRFFELPKQDDMSVARVIIVRSGAMEIALQIDEIMGVRSLSLEDIRPTLPTLTGGSAPYLRGVTGDRLVLLDIAKLLADPKIVVNEEVNA